MKEFILAALPFVVIGVCLAAFFAKPSKKTDKNYMTEGLSIGMALGIAFSSLYDGNLALGLTLGMLVGEVVGMQIPKKED